MHGNFEPLDEYNGDIIRIDRLIEFLPTEHWSWDETGEIDLDNISVAIHDAISEVSEPYGDTWEHPVLEQKSKEWHIGRIIYFINHPKCQTAHCGRYIPHFDFSAKPSPIVPYRHLPQSLSGMTADCRSLV